MKKQNKQTKSKLKVIESKVLGGFPVLNMCVRGKRGRKAEVRRGR